MELAPLSPAGAIDSGADEELFRRMGQRVVSEALAQRWQEADGPAILQCDGCQQSLKPLGRRKRTLHTLCGPTRIDRRVYYCRQCRQIRAPLDRRLGVEQVGMTPGLMRAVCRVALELAYQQSAQLLTETLGFSPCSAREVERVAKRHGQQIEQLQRVGKALSPRPPLRKRSYCLAIDAVMIPGLPDPNEHRLNWRDVKLAVVFDPRSIRLPIYVAGREDAESFGSRLWNQLQLHGLEKDNFRLILGDGASWIWNLVDLHLPGVAQLLDFYHAAQHLYATAELVWPQVEANRWWHRRLEQLKHGEMTNFFDALKRLVRAHEVDDWDHSPKRLLNYFLDNESRLGYDRAIKNHLPIGSGAVESAARHIVQQRLKQSGMRWSEDGAQSILNLRTLHRSGEYEQYWENFATAELSA